jgi:alkyldihydroxyacetonephosphate synthase
VNSEIPKFDFLHVDCEKFREEIQERGIECSTSLEDRYFRASGQSAQDLVQKLHNRIPDIVVWPRGHEDAEFIVKKANEHNVMIIPFGGENSCCELKKSD